MADVLALGAHPDDVEIGCGGLLARLTRGGRSVVIADLTRGESATRGTPEERRGEARAAAEVLGAESRENLDLGDGRIDGGIERRNALIRLYRTVRPSLVVAPYFSDFHPDHAATGHLAKAALYMAGIRKVEPDLAPHRPSHMIYYFSHEEIAPSFVVDISEDFDVKQKAIRCFASQLHDPSRQEPETMISASGFLEQLAVRDRYWGGRIRARYGEAYFQIEPPRVDDPFSLLPRST